MRLGTNGVHLRFSERWRATRAGAFLSDIGGSETEYVGLAEAFPERLRLRLAGYLAAVTALAITVRVPFFGDGISASDTTVFLEVAHEISGGHFPSDLRPPGYSLLLALFEGLGIDPVSGVVALQNVIGILLPALLVLIGWRFFRPAVGLMAGLLAAASPLMIVTEQAALADFLFGVLVLVGTALLAEATLRIRADRSTTRILVATGAAFGLATMLRANGELAVIVIPVLLLIATRSLRRAIRPAVTALLAMLVVVLPWVLSNAVAHGRLTIATEGGISLYARAIGWDEVPPSASTADGRLALSIYNIADVSQARPALQMTTPVFDALVSEGKTQAEASAAMGAIAKDAILRDPWTYLEGSGEILELDRRLYDPRTFTANQYVDQITVVRNYFRGLSPGITNLPGDSKATRIPWQLGQSFTELLYVVTIGGLLGLLLPFVGAPRRRLASTTFVIVVLAALLGASFTAIYSPRYDIMFAPMIWIVASATLALLAEALAALVRRRPWRQAQSPAA